MEMAKLWLTYKKAAGQVERARHIFGSDARREAVFLRLPVPRVRMTAMDRKKRLCPREGSNYMTDCTYDGVAPVCAPWPLQY